MDNFIREETIRFLQKGERSLADICRNVSLTTIRGTTKVVEVVQSLVDDGILGSKKYHWWKIKFYLIEKGDTEDERTR